MSKIITDPLHVSKYLRSTDRAAEQSRLEGIHNKRQLEREIAMDPEEKIFREKDSVLAQAIGMELVHNYPGHGWQVECDIRNGVAKIFNCHMSGQHGYMLHLKNLNPSTFRADIMRVGGTVLESFGLDRGKAIEHQIIEKQRDHAGSVKADY